jgi:membrane-associated phospholipid phosphatase
MSKLTAGLATAAGREPRPLLARQPWIGYGLALAGAVVFAILAFNVATAGPLLTWDKPIDDALHQRALHAGAIGLDLIKIGGALGRETALIIIVPLAVYWLIRRHWRPFMLLLAGTIGGEILFELLSRLFNRPRPVFANPLDKLTGPGFPSGHSQTAILLYGLLLYLLLPRLRSRWARLAAVVVTVLIALAIGIARLLIGDHYPTDVLAGYAMGFLWGGLVYTSLELYLARHPAETVK